MATQSRLIRIFISSPGDVSEERKIAQQILDDLLYDPLFVEKIAIRVVAWDKPGAGTYMLANMSPQAAIDAGLPKPSQCDIVVVIFWSRMGTPLTHEGVDYSSGTHYEYEDAMKASRATNKPSVVLYRRTEKVLFAAADPKFNDKVAQYQRVQDFFNSFTDEQGRLTTAYNTYEKPADFAREFEHHMRGLIKKLLDEPAPP